MKVEPVREINWVKNSLANFIDNLIDRQKKKQEEINEMAKNHEPLKGRNIDVII